MRAVIVHGHRRRGDALISAECERRVRAAVRYVQTHRTEIVILSGRGLAGLGHASEAAQMEGALLVAGGEWPSYYVGLEDQSGSTAENAWLAGNLAQDLGATEVVVITSWWHALRVKRAWGREWPDLKISVRPAWGSVRYLPGELDALWRSWTRG